MASSPTNGTVAVRGAQRPAQQGAALAIRAGQSMWDERQTAALVAMGVPGNASKAELATFLHQCQRSGLDPFSRQIYLIYRNTYDNGRAVMKPTVQTGIDGYRLIRDRIAKREGLAVEYDDTIWYASDGQAWDVWLWDEPPAACKVAIRIDGRRYSSTLRFNEYSQKKKDGNLNKMWSEKPAHMIEKCAEADVLRRAFPQDMSGLLLEDTAPDSDAPPPAPARPSAAQIRQQRQQPVKAEVVDAPPPEEPPAEPDGEEPEADNGPPPGSEAYKRKMRAAQAQAKKLFGDDADARHAAASRVLGIEVASFSDLTAPELEQVAATFNRCETPADLAEFLDGPLEREASE